MASVLAIISQADTPLWASTESACEGFCATYPGGMGSGVEVRGHVIFCVEPSFFSCDLTELEVRLHSPMLSD